MLRATNHWDHFFSSLTREDITVLDRAAAGHKMKAVCRDLDVNYDTLQKRFRRWQDDLKLTSLNSLLIVWWTVRAKERPVDADHPAILRLATEVATETARRLKQPALDVEIPAAQRVRQLPAEIFAKSVQRRRGTPVTLTQCVLSPALWHALLSIAQELGALALRRAHICAQHRLFLATIAPDQPIAAGDQPINKLLAWLKDTDRATSMMSTGRGTPVALPLVVAARRAGALDAFGFSGAECALAHAALSAADDIWQQVAAASATSACAALDDMAVLHDFWRRESSADSRAKLDDHSDSVPTHTSVDGIAEPTTPTTVLGPMSGLTMALMATQIKQPTLALAAAERLNTMVRARLRHAEILGVHPVRLLAYFSMMDAGIVGDPKSFELRRGELLLDEDATEYSLIEVAA